MNDNEKIRSEGEIIPQSDLGKKFDNFWYYNKWKVLIALFALFVLVVCIIQVATREKSDVKIIAAVDVRPTDEKVPAMARALSDEEPESVGKNGVGFNILDVYSEDYLTALDEQLKALKASGGDESVIKEKSAELNYCKSATSTNYQNFCQLIMTGEYSVLIVDRWVYDKLKGVVGFRAVSELTDQVAESAKYDECAVYFKKTAFYARHQGAFSGLDDEVVICLCIYSPYKATVGCGGGSDRYYQDSVEIFKALAVTSK